MDNVVAYIDGIGWWSPGVPDWDSAARILRGDDTAPAAAAANPAAAALSPNERRRAPEPVLLACEVAGQACAMAACDPATLPCVFASAHGDISITDALCETLASEPLQTSPTKFHNSVHNAPAGYWTIAAQCHAPSSAIAAWHGSFAAGLLEAAVEAHADMTPVLFAAYDIAARGALACAVAAREPGAAALIVSSKRGPHTRAVLRLRHETNAALPSPVPPALRSLAATNLLAAALPLFVAIARLSQGSPLAGTDPLAVVRLRNGAATSLAIEVLA